jgi:hypothetical protein
MIPLHAKITRKNLIAELQEGRFDFLEGVHPMNLLRVDEVHPSKDNDTHYLFLIWVREQDTSLIGCQIRKNLRKFGKPAGPIPGREWTVRVLPDTGEGLIIVSTWLG